MPSLQNYKVVGNINHRLPAIHGIRRKIYSEKTVKSVFFLAADKLRWTESI